MPHVIGRSTANSPTKPVLSTFTIATNLVVNGANVNGALVTPVSLEYEILDLSTAEKENAPVVVVPRTALNLTTSKVGTGTGRYAPTWTVPANQAIGRHLIRWFSTLVEDGPEVEWFEHFDVMGTTVGLPSRALYATISDVRAEGVGDSIPDRRILEILARACDRLDEWTGRVFWPIWKQVAVDGSDQRILVFGEPIIALEQVLLTDGVTSVEPGAFTVYNRHLTGMVVPDDRENPRIEYRSDWWSRRLTGNTYGYPSMLIDAQWGGRSSQAIQVKGVFGYTEPDGSPAGGVPSLAREVVVLMTLRELPKQNTQQAKAKQREAFIKSMRTREQQVQWADVDAEGGAAAMTGAVFTGDPYIDTKIAQLCPAVSGAST